MAADNIFGPFCSYTPRAAGMDLLLNLLVRRLVFPILYFFRPGFQSGFCPGTCFSTARRSGASCGSVSASNATSASMIPPAGIMIRGAPARSTGNPEYSPTQKTRPQRTGLWKVEYCFLPARRIGAIQSLRRQRGRPRRRAGRDCPSSCPPRHGSSGPCPGCHQASSDGARAPG